MWEILPSRRRTLALTSEHSTSSIWHPQMRRRSNGTSASRQLTRLVRSLPHRGRSSHGCASANCRSRLDDRSAAGAELMSAPSSPGRTWRRFDCQRRMRRLARTFSGAVRIGRGSITCLPNVAGVSAPAPGTHAYDARRPVDKHRHDRGHRRKPGVALAAISIAVLCCAQGCRTAPAESETQDGVRRVSARVRGIT